MRVEVLPGSGNVIRFPVERRARPTLELLRGVKPSACEMLDLAYAFEMDPPVRDLRERADAASAEHIANQVPPHGPEREAMLRALEAEAIDRAIAAARDARDARLDAVQAEKLLRRGQAGGHFWLAPLRQRAWSLGARLAALVLEAHALAEEAEGVARAVGFARRGEAWVPRDFRAEADEVLFGGSRRLA